MLIARKAAAWGWLLSLVVILALVQYGVRTSRLGESRDSYGVLDDSVRPFLGLVAR